MSKYEEIRLLPVQRPRRRTGSLYEPGREPPVRPYVDPLVAKRKKYWSSPVVQNPKRSLLDRLFNKD